MRSIYFFLSEKGRESQYDQDHRIFRLRQHGRGYRPGLCKAADPQNVWLANRTAAKAEALAAELGCNTTINDEVAGRCDLIFLAVKPQMMEELLAPLRFTLAERPGRFVLCSMAAGLSIARIQEMAGGDCPVIRIMPNTPASVGAGMIQYLSLIHI